MTHIAELIALAEKHAPEALMVSSANACIYDAKKCRSAGLYQSARMWALKSLAHSVGVTSPVYTYAERFM